MKSGRAGEEQSGNGMQIRFWGVRGSHPVPGPETLKTGGNTPCVEVRAGGRIIILDAGTGIVGLGRELVTGSRERPGGIAETTLLISHTHHDHTQGFPFFQPIYRSAATIHILGPRYGEESLADALKNALLSPYFPVPLDGFDARLVIEHLDGGESILYPDQQHVPVVSRNASAAAGEGPVIRVMRGGSHPGWGVLVFRIEYEGKSLVYATDTEGGGDEEERLTAFCRGCDVLIHDAQYQPDEYEKESGGKRGYGHSTYSMACRVAERSAAGRLFLFHFSPEHDDRIVDENEKTARTLFPRTTAAREGTIHTL